MIKEREILIALYLIIAGLLLIGFSFVSKYLMIIGVVLAITWFLLLKYYTNVTFVRYFLLIGIAISALYGLGVITGLFSITALFGIQLNVIFGVIVGICGIMLIPKFGLV